MTADRPDVELLADLDAGLPVEEHLRAAALAHPQARAVLDALAATRAELRALPPVPVPPAARWTGTLPARPAARLDRPATRAPAGRPVPPAERRTLPAPPARPGTPARGPGAVRPVGRPRGRRVRRLAVVTGLLLAVALVLGDTVGGRPGVVEPGTVGARDPSRPATSTLDGGVELVAAARASVGVRDAGALTDPVHRAGCLRAVAVPGVAPDAPLFGGRRVRFEGRPGVLLLLGTGELGAFRVVVVDPGCGPGGGTLLADARVGP